MAEVIMDLKDPAGWTRENNPHPAPDYVRLYPNRDGSHWSDYMEYYDYDKLICHTCISRAKIGSGNCVDGGDYFWCVRTGHREELRRKYECKTEVQSTLEGLF